MQISSINNSSSQFKNNNVGFKSAIPVVFWEKVGGKYEIVQDITKIERMQDILVRRANGTGAKSDAAMQERFNVMSLLYKKDRDYRLAFDKNIIPGNVFIKFADGIKRLVKLRLSNGQETPITLKLAKSTVSSFYPKKEHTGWIYGKFNPFVYLMTGADYEAMKYMGREIGLEARRGSDDDIIRATKNMYVDKGKYLSSMPTKEELHVIMEESRGKYKLNKLDMRPSEGPESPYVKMGYCK